MPSAARPYRWIVRGVKVDPETKQGYAPVEIECKVAILAAGAMGTAPILMRSRQSGAIPGASPTSRQAPRRQRRSRGRDRGRREEGPQRPRPSRWLPGLPQGQADHDDELRPLGRQARQPPRRNPVHAAGDPPLPAHQLPLRQRPLGRRRADLVGPRQEALDLELVAAHRDPGDGRGHQRRRVLRGAADGQRARAAERRPDRDRALQLHDLGAVAAGPRARPTPRSAGSASGAGSAAS